MFQPNIYKLFNNDLKKLNNNQLLLHWKTIGKNENRISNISEFFNKYPDFQIVNYKNMYKEINNYDDLIVMSHYHHNINLNDKNSNKDISIHNNPKTNIKLKKSINIIDKELSTIDIKNNYLYNYLNNYYNHTYNLAIIIIDNLFNDNINEFKFDYDIYYINDHKNINTSFNNINLKFDINLIQNFIINLNYDYFLFPKKNISNITENINKNPNIIIDDSYIIINKNYLKFINFYDLYHLNFNNYNINKLIINKKNTDYINFKFYDLLYISLNINKIITKTKIFIDIDSDDIKNLFKIMKIICFLEKHNIDIFINHNNSNILNKYFINDEYSINSDIIYNLEDITENNDDTMIYKINDDFKFDLTDFNLLNKLNYDNFNNVLKELLYLDLKKDIIIIYLDKYIDESFIIKSLININFIDSIIITINYQKNKYEIFNNLSFIDITKLVNYTNFITYNDLLLFIGFYADYYIGPTNYISKIWNYLNRNLILYLPVYDKEYINNKNLIINRNKLSLNMLDNCIINYNYDLFKIINDKLISVKSIYNYYTDYYFNDYIFNMYFTINSIILTNTIDTKLYDNKNISFIKNNNNYYIKYFDNFIKIIDEFTINNYNEYFIDSSINNIKYKVINNYVFIIKIIDNSLINYYINLFNKYYYNTNYKIEFFCILNSIDNNLDKINNDNININYINNDSYFDIFETIVTKYTINDLIFIIKNNNFNIINLNKTIINLIIKDDDYLLLEKDDYILFNTYVINQNIYKLNDILNINRVFDFIYNIDSFIKNYLNNFYVNDNNIQDIFFNKCMLTKFLIYQKNYKYINNSEYNLFDISENIKYFNYNIKNNNLKIIFFDDKFYEYKIDFLNFNKYLNKSDINHKIIYCIDDDYKYSEINLNNKIILNECNHLLYLIIDNINLKKFGYLNDFYFSNKSLIEINLFFINNILNINFYKIIDEKILEYDFKFSNKLNLYFINIDFNKIINIRKLINIDIKFENLFDIIIINLKDRKDKKKYMINQMDNLNINNYKFFEGIKISKDELTNYNYIKSESFLNNLNINYVIGSAGCKISHYEIIKNIKNNNKYTIILEDDVVLEYNFMYYIMNSLQQIKNKYFDLLYLGCNLENKNDNSVIDNNLIKVNNPKTTTAYLVKNSNTLNIINTIQNSSNEIDNTYSESNLTKLCIFPMIAYQKNIKSDIVSNNDYGYYHDKFYF